MLEFAPVPGMALTFGDQRYQFLPHPALPAAMNEVWVVEGGEALVYPLQEATSGVRVALKIMKAAFRGPILAYSVATLTPLASRPGFRVADRVLLTRAQFPAQVAQFPALDHTIIMPWVAGVSWASCLGGTGWPGAFTRAQASDYATRLAKVLATWEAAHLAHTDIAGGNVILNETRVEVIDCDRIYGPDAPSLQHPSLGTPGYQHPHLGPQGQWCAPGDRFAGAVLLTEMLTWWDAAVRAQMPRAAETLFQPGELGVLETPKWHAVRNALWKICPDALVLFDLAWTAPNLAGCPPLLTWAEVLATSPRN